jgi:hypothetical protein
VGSLAIIKAVRAASSPSPITTIRFVWMIGFFFSGSSGKGGSSSLSFGLHSEAGLIKNFIVFNNYNLFV